MTPDFSQIWRQLNFHVLSLKKITSLNYVMFEFRVWLELLTMVPTMANASTQNQNIISLHA